MIQDSYGFVFWVRFRTAFVFSNVTASYFNIIYRSFFASGPFFLPFSFNTIGMTKVAPEALHVRSLLCYMTCFHEYYGFSRGDCGFSRFPTGCRFEGLPFSKARLGGGKSRVDTMRTYNGSHRGVETAARGVDSSRAACHLFLNYITVRRLC